MTRQRERGSGPVTALLLLGIVALVFAAGVAALGGIAGNEKSAAQHAADAAALAGAQGVLEVVPDLLAPGFLTPAGIPTLIGGGSCMQIGRAQAADLAAANGAGLTSYCYNVFRDQVSVGVAMNATQVSGPVATARAEAATRFDATSCALDPRFDQPSPAPTAAADADPPAPPAPKATWLDCGFGHLTVVFQPSDLRFHFSGLAGELADLKPRLTA